MRFLDRLIEGQNEGEVYFLRAGSWAKSFLVVRFTTAESKDELGLAAVAQW